MNTKTISLSEIVAGRIYSWVVANAIDLNMFPRNPETGKVDRKGTPNPYLGRVTKRMVLKANAGTWGTYARVHLDTLGTPWVPKEGRTPTTEKTENPCVVRSLSNGDLQAILIKPKISAYEVFIDGKPATPAEVEAIKPYRKPEDSSPWLVATVSLASLTNCEE